MQPTEENNNMPSDAPVINATLDGDAEDVLQEVQNIIAPNTTAAEAAAEPVAAQQEEQGISDIEVTVQDNVQAPKVRTTKEILESIRNRNVNSMNQDMNALATGYSLHTQDADKPTLGEVGKNAVSYLTDPIYRRSVNPVYQGVTEGIKNSVTSVGDVLTAFDLVNEDTMENLDEKLSNVFGIVDDEENGFVWNAVKDITSFGTAFLGVAKATKGIQAVSKAGQAAKVALQSALADFASQDPTEDRLSNSIEALTGINIYTAKDEDDSRLEGRIKNAIEGLFVEGAVLGTGTVIAKSATLARKLRRANTEADAQQAIEQYAKEMGEAEDAVKANQPAAAQPAEEAAQSVQNKYTGKTLTEEASAETKTSQSPAPETPKAPEAPDLKPDVDAPKEPPLLSAKEFKEIVEKANTEKEAFRDITETMNLRNLDVNDPRVSHVIKGIGEAIQDKTIKAQGRVSHREVLKRVIKDDNLIRYKKGELSLEDAIARAEDNATAVRAMADQTLELRHHEALLTEEILNISNKIDVGTATALDRVKMLQMISNIGVLHKTIADTRTEIARALSSQRIKVTDKTLKRMFGDADKRKLDLWQSTKEMTQDDAEQWLIENNIDSTDLKRMALAMKMNKDDPAQLRNLIKNGARTTGKGRYIYNIGYEFWINNILSSATTQAFNLVGGLLKTLDEPLAKILSGGAQTVFTAGRNREMLEEGIAQLVGTFSAVGQAVKFGGKAFKLGGNVLMYKDPAEMAIRNRALSAEGLQNSAWFNGEDVPEKLGTVMDLLGIFTNGSSRLMLTSDEVVKQIAYRASVHSELVMKARRQGLKGDDVKTFVENNFDNYITKQGEAVISEDTVLHRQRALEATWQQPIKNKSIQAFFRALDTPGINLLVPFKKTPWNIFQDIIEHTPFLGLTTQRARQNRGVAVGKQLQGAIIMGIGWYLAANGRLTGSPPVNTKEYKAWFSAGNKPYSLKVGDTWVDIRRLDPFGTLLCLTSDVYQMLERDSSFYGEETNTKWLYQTAGSLIANMSDKTFLVGLNNLTNLFSDPTQGNFQKAYTSVLSGFVPYKGLLSTIKAETDPYMREADSLYENIIRTIPVLSKDLPARMHPVYGTPIKGSVVFHKNEFENDVVMKELLKYQDDVVLHPAPVMKGISLDKAQYSRLMELRGTMRIEGKTMGEWLREVITSKDYQDFPDSYFDAEGKSPKAKQLNKIIQTFTKAAQEELAEESPEVDTKVKRRYVQMQLEADGTINSETTYDEKEQLITQFLNMF